MRRPHAFALPTAFTVLCAFGLLCAAPLAAQTQQVTKIGVLNFSKVYLSIYQQTKAVRDYEKANSDYSAEAATRSKAILDLQAQRLDADKAGDKTKSAALDKSIADQQKDLDTFRKVKLAQLATMKEAASTSAAVLQIMDVVKLLAESEGYSLILRSDTDVGQALILYRILEIDLTDDVITELQKRNGITPTPGG